MRSLKHKYRMIIYEGFIGWTHSQNPFSVVRNVWKEKSECITWVIRTSLSFSTEVLYPPSIILVTVTISMKKIASFVIIK